jgi:hypothetical protein
LMYNTCPPPRFAGRMICAEKHFRNDLSLNRLYIT